MSDQRDHDAVAAAARGSYGRLLAFLARRTSDLAGVEDALADAFLAALASWPQCGVPNNPEAWLIVVARRRLVDAARRRKSQHGASDRLTLMQAELEAAMAQASEIADERLALMFACAHPAIEAGVGTALMLQTVLGLDAAAVASAFLVLPSALAQRLVRAKAKIRQAGIPCRVPAAHELPARLDAVLGAIYAAFCEGWSEAGGTGVRRREPACEAIRLGRLVALMLFAEARRHARRDAGGDYVPLGWQDTTPWDGAMLGIAR